MTTLLDFLIAALRACRHDVRVLNPDFGAGGRECLATRSTLLRASREGNRY